MVRVKLSPDLYFTDGIGGYSYVTLGFLIYKICRAPFALAYPPKLFQRTWFLNQGEKLLEKNLVSKSILNGILFTLKNK
jgi:hypothetical protein